MNAAATILVVEDEQIIAQDIRQTLSDLGYAVPRTVATGVQAFQYAEALKPQLVLMDIKLRGETDGIAAASEIRRCLGIPIVYLTSHSDDATLARAAETHPYGYLVKPFNDRDLRTAIEVALQKHEFEEQLQARERWFATTLDSIGDAVLATDSEGIITFMNPVAMRVTGWTRAEAIGREVDEVIRLTSADGQAVENPVHVALRDAQTVLLPPKTSMVLRTGTKLVIDDSASPIVDDKGRVVGGVVVFRDVTERAKLEQRLAQSERLASIGTMAAGTGHEINNPLTYVVANLGFSLRGLKEIIGNLRGLNVHDEDKGRFESAMGRLQEIVDALRDADDGADRVRRIVRDLKKFTRVDGDGSGIVELADVLEAAVRMTAHTLRHHARLRKDYGKTPPVEVSEGQLAQVFMNVLMNASEAIGEGDAEHHEIHVRTYTNDGGEAVAEIRDTGPGIPPQILPRIFDPFFSTKPVGSGMGLGLAICHSIVASYGGEITAESTVGEGTTFRVVLPPARPVSGTIKSARPSSRPPRRGRVLVIDDEEALALAIARILRSEHDVTVETDARAALVKIAGGETYDAIFCDVMMPNVSGIDVYEALQASAPELAKRIVFMTGGAFSTRARAFLEKVPNVSISKPFTL
ncbi:MAG: response regulator, partial [Polyangiaceae bacterium]